MPWRRARVSPLPWTLSELQLDSHTCLTRAAAAARGAGEKHTYQEVIPVLARLMQRPFMAANSTGDQYGPAGSFLVQVRAPAAPAR
jgi:hypothetical protein